MSLRARHVAEGLQGAGHEWSRVVRTERRRWHDRAYRGRVWFDEEVRRRHKRFRQSIPAFLRDGTLGNLLTTPVIYSLALPFLLLDLWVSVYQAICFPIYGIAGVRRRLALHDRPPQARLSQWDREGQLPVLQLRRRRGGLRPGSARQDRAVLVPDQAWSRCPRASRSLSTLF